MIWSSRARKRSPDPVVSCFLGRIDPSLRCDQGITICAQQESKIAKRICKLPGRQSPKPCNIKSSSSLKIQLPLNRLAVLHGRLRPRLASSVIDFASCEESVATRSRSRLKSPDRALPLPPCAPGLCVDPGKVQLEKRVLRVFLQTGLQLLIRSSPIVIPYRLIAEILGGLHDLRKRERRCHRDRHCPQFDPRQIGLPVCFIRKLETSMT